MVAAFHQMDATPADWYLDGIQVESRPIATPFALTSRAKADIRLPNPNTHVANNQGWVAMKIKPSWAATVDNFENTGNDLPGVWS